VDDWYSFKMLLATFKEVYPYSYILPAFNKVGSHVLGSTKPIDCSLEKIKEKLAVTSVAQDIFEWDAIPLDYFKELVPFELSSYRGVINTDDRPFLEFNLLRYLNRGTRKSSSLIHW
jgi:hypothetical protein